MSDSENTVLTARDIRKEYPSGQGQLQVLNGVNLQVRRGELVAIMGASGAGKSTLLHILGMLEEPTSGQLLVYDTDIASLDEVSLARFRNRHIGFVFQHHHLLPEFTALENAMMPVLIARRGGAMRDAAIDLLSAVGLEHRMDHRPSEMSGGECQRVAMVRALIMQPKIVLADEPSGNLDEATSAALHALLRDVAQRNQQAFLVMTHDERLASSMDRRGYLESGVLHLED
tara:strand:+ start:115 stop:804 length:690 start_codon:yes stop_codon:yes gene_type:complete